MTRLASLVEQWRAFAAQLEPYTPAAATAWRAAADELEAADRQAADETLTLEAAALASGYSVESLRKQVASGRIPNAGRKHAPRIRRGDLPKRAPREAASPTSSTYDPDADALSLLGRRRAS